MRAQLTRQARIALALHNRRGTARRKAFKLGPEHFTGSPDVIEAVVSQLKATRLTVTPAGRRVSTIPTLSGCPMFIGHLR